METTPLTAAVIVVSEEVVRGEDSDRVSAVALAALAEYGVQASSGVVGDDPAAIVSAVLDALEAGCRLIITCGGTGVGPTDVTPQSIRPLLAFELPGIAEEIRRRGLAKTPVSLLSREVAGVVIAESLRPALLVAAPGSRGGVRDAVAVLGPLLPELARHLDGDRDW